MEEWWLGHVGRPVWLKSRGQGELQVMLESIQCQMKALRLVLDAVGAHREFQAERQDDVFETIQPANLGLSWSGDRDRRQGPQHILYGLTQGPLA